MAYSIRSEFHSNLAYQVINEIQYRRSNYYYFVGKIDPWAGTDFAPTVNQIDSEYENNIIRTNALYFKKIEPNDVSIVTARYNWATGLVWENWDHTKNMEPLKFYCTTDENKVYKCLDNNYGGVSSVKPTGNSFAPLYTADGYTWKYMYTIPAFKQSRFASLNFIPVQRALTDSFYNKGSIDSVTVTNQGSGYSNVLQTTINVVGTTTGSGATGTITVGASGNITSVTITNGGTGYTAGVNVDFTTTFGSGAVATANITAGVITGLTFTNTGVGYKNGEVINFTVGGAVLIPALASSTGTISKVIILKSGAGYVSAPTLTVVGTGGSGKYSHATALLTAIIYQGKIVEVNIQDPGQSYPSSAATTINVLGDGTGAQFTPIIYGGKLIDIVVDNAGIGYTTVTLSVVGSGSGATLLPNVSGSDFISDQSIIEQTTVPGAIYSIKVTTPGDNYTATAVVNITGDGTGATAIPVVSGGSIVGIQITNPGSNYTYSDVTITDVNRTVAITPIDCVAYAILPPVKGHGKDAVTELFGKTVAINSSLRQDVDLNGLLQEYRQYGIIKNPAKLDDSSMVNIPSELVTYVVNFNTNVNLVKDEILLNSGVKFRVVNVNTNNTVTLQMIGNKQISFTPFVAETNITRTYTLTSIVSRPTIDKYSGYLSYVSNENPFSFTESQGITIKTFLTF